MNNLRFIRICLPMHKQGGSFPIQCFSSFYPVKMTGGTVYSLHTSCTSLRRRKFDDLPIEERVYKKPVDWLPFKWDRRMKFNIFKQSGDTIHENTIDRTLPKPDFELSDELKNADPKVQHYFSLLTASKSEVKEVCKRHLLKKVQRHPTDLTSLEVRIALMTVQVRALFEHNAEFSKKEVYISRIVLPIIIQKRNKLLKELRAIDEERFQWILKELDLYFNPRPVDLVREWYCKKWDLRRLTKEYCENQVAAKKTAYHNELKEQQGPFLEEKKQALAWIEEEQKAIEALRLKL